MVFKILYHILPEPNFTSPNYARANPPPPGIANCFLFVFWGHAAPLCSVLMIRHLGCCLESQTGGSDTKKKDSADCFFFWVRRDEREARRSVMNMHIILFSGCTKEHLQESPLSASSC